MWLLIILAYLSSEFGAKYEESGLFNDFFRYQRKPGTPGKEVTRSLTNTLQKIHVAGMPVTMSAAEIQYYLHELSLLSKHRAIFLAQLSGRADVSDAHLKYLIGTTDSDGNRRESSILTMTSSAKRTQLFEARLTLIIAYLEHDPGGTGAALAVTTSGTCDDTTTSGPTEGRPLRRLRQWTGSGVGAPQGATQESRKRPGKSPAPVLRHTRMPGLAPQCESGR